MLRRILRPKAFPADLVPAWEAFQAQAERIESAREALLGCLPIGRVDPAPVPVGLDTLRDELDAVAAELDRWRVPAMSEHWERCRTAVEQAREAIDPAREAAEATGELEELLGAVSGVVEPLDAWHEAEVAWRQLRRRE